MKSEVALVSSQTEVQRRPVTGPTGWTGLGPPTPPDSRNGLGALNQGPRPLLTACDGVENIFPSS